MWRCEFVVTLTRYGGADLYWIFSYVLNAVFIWNYNFIYEVVFGQFMVSFPVSTSAYIIMEMMAISKRCEQDVMLIGGAGENVIKYEEGPCPCLSFALWRSQPLQYQLSMLKHGDGLYEKGVDCILALDSNLDFGPKSLMLQLSCAINILLHWSHFHADPFFSLL